MSVQKTIIQQAVSSLLEQFKTSLPQLNAVIIFLPNSSAAQDFRRQLLKQAKKSGYDAIIPPWIGTIKEWINASIVLPNTSLTIISEQARRLLFVEALKQHPKFFKEENKWQVSISLLKLFDDLNLHHATVSNSSTEWLNTVQNAYNIEQINSQLQQEAELIHTLWHAWHQQLQANNLVDDSSAYVLRLQEAIHQLPENFYCYSLGTEYLLPCEIKFLQSLTDIEKCLKIEKTGAIKNYSHQFLQHVFEFNSAPIKERVEHFKTIKQEHVLPISIHTCKDVESEATAIDLKIRQWLLNGVKNIGVVSEDRKLSRRLRALLERANVPMQDISGWSLATTSAASVLERWLECIEENFDYRPMLDFLKSHFVNLGTDRDELLNNVYRLEKDIIQHEGIASGLSRYKEHLHFRLNKLKHWPEDSYDKIIDLLGKLEQTAKPLQQLYTSKENQPLDAFLSVLVENINQLGLEQAFSNDPAGIRILQTLADMKHSLSYCNPSLQWDDFRIWLGTSLEEHMFSPQTEASPVQLMTLEQSQLRNFDALVIAAADRQFFPGSPPASPFFNQQVKKTLGLTCWSQQCAQRLDDFKQLLANTNDTLITYKSENNGEETPPSPWVEALENFHQLCFDKSLTNNELPELILAHDGVLICDSDELPSQTRGAAPKAPGDLQPRRISAGAHQRLINCPYQFFSGDLLKLKPTDEISEELKKSDYGERVHKALQDFHQQSGSASEFTHPVTEENRDQAIAHLSNISKTIFNTDLESNIIHRSWLHRWLKHVPSYIDWQIRQQQNWSVNSVEENLEKEISPFNSIFGRLDRVDKSVNKNNGEHYIIDYKTGRSARQYDVDCGENIQLTTYALLDEASSNIVYLILDNSGQVKEGAKLSGDELKSIKSDVFNRLVTMLGMIKQEKKLPAWGDTITCSYCHFEGLCRKTVVKT